MRSALTLLGSEPSCRELNARVLLLSFTLMDSPESVPAVLGEISQLERSLSARNSSDRDVEKDAPLDLREYLTSANDATGARPKRVGVTWEDLEVVGAGGLDNKVSLRSIS